MKQPWRICIHKNKLYAVATTYFYTTYLSTVRNPETMFVRIVLIEKAEALVEVMVFNVFKPLNIRPCTYFSTGVLSQSHAFLSTINYANLVYGVSTICHQVRCLRWGHPSFFHTATSLFILYKMFRMREIPYRLRWVEFINMLSVYAQSGTQRHFNWWLIAVLT